MAKVTVGIPTYNRPEGLEKTITMMQNQSVSDIEIIVSNNCSTDSSVEEVLHNKKKEDSRIKVFNQKENIGIIRNFLAVLSEANSDYFMWAADDDQWAPSFIEVCLKAHESAQVGSVMTGFKRYLKPIDKYENAILPKMDGVSKFRDCEQFFEFMPHSIIYGLHKRSALNFLLNVEVTPTFFDDEIIVPRLILDGGFLTIPEVSLYAAGINELPYKIKTPMEAEGKRFIYYKRIVHFINYIAEKKDLEDIQKLRILQLFITRKLWTLLVFEKENRPSDQYTMASQIYNILKNVDVRKIAELSAIVNLVKGCR